MPSSTPIATVIAAKVAAGGVEEKSAAEAQAEADDDDDADYVSPCKERSFALHSAELAFTVFDTKALTLRDTADPHPLVEDLEKLLEHPCFELAATDPKDELTFDSGFALRHWWREGGRDWLAAYLRMDERRAVRVPPTPRISLTRETAPKDHPLLPLMCSADERVPCGSETAGWVRRAEHEFSLVAEANRRTSPAEQCEEEARKEPAHGRYASFRDCVEHASLRERALPLGRFKAPTDGWFVIMTDEHGCRWLRAYDLAAGSTYSINDCSAKVETESGRVPVGALREAAWMMMLAPATQGGVHQGSGHHVPDDFPITRVRGESIGLGMISTSGGHYERHTWSWMREKNGVLRGQVSGVVIGHGGDDEALTYAFGLLDVAADAFTKGCAPSPPPSRIAWGAPGPAVKEGADVVLDDNASAAVRLALPKATPSSRACAKTP